MKPFKLALTAVILVAAVTVPWLLNHRAAAELHAREELFQSQSLLLADLTANNQRLTNRLAVAEAQPLPDSQVRELLKLRNEISQLRQAPDELSHTQRRIRRLREMLQGAEEEVLDPPRATALLAEEMQVRQARVDRLKSWLEQTPQEKIPELQYVKDERWVDRVDRPLITEEDYSTAMALLRSDGEGVFQFALYKALKAYAKANHNQFPDDVAQLKPYFKQPVEDAMLQRYHIVAVSTLPPTLDEVGGDWVLTQKAPINKKLDGRAAIGLTNLIDTLAEGRWDPVP